MVDQVIGIYCIVDDTLKGLGHSEDPQTVMKDSEVLTTALVAALFFGGNHQTSRYFLMENNYFPKMLSKSRFNRRLHRIKELLLTLFDILAESFKSINEESIYLIDTFPIPVCDNVRIKNCKIYSQEQYRGYQASKKQYFYGLKLHLCVTADGQPVESPKGRRSALFPHSW